MEASMETTNIGIFSSRSKKFDKILMLDGCFSYDFW